MEPSTLPEVWLPIQRRAVENASCLRGMRLKRCTEADGEHRESTRQFMHVGHIGHITVCYAAAAEHLPIQYQVGLLVHEIGHILGFQEGDLGHSEDDANEYGRLVTGIHVKWRSPLHLEWAAVPAWLRQEIKEEQWANDGRGRKNMRAAKRRRGRGGRKR